MNSADEETLESPNISRCTPRLANILTLEIYVDSQYFAFLLALEPCPLI